MLVEKHVLKAISCGRTIYRFDNGKNLTVLNGESLSRMYLKGNYNDNLTQKPNKKAGH